MMKPISIKKANCIMIVDDNKMDVWLVTKIIEMNNLCEKTITAKNGEDALKLIKEYYNENKSLPECIIVDLEMPVLNGFELLANIMDLQFYYKENTKLIVLTVHDELDNLLKLRDLGIKDVLIKPLDKNLLIKILNEE